MKHQEHSLQEERQDQILHIVQKKTSHKKYMQDPKALIRYGSDDKYNHLMRTKPVKYAGGLIHQTAKKVSGAYHELPSATTIRKELDAQIKRMGRCLSFRRAQPMGVPINLVRNLPEEIQNTISRVANNDPSLTSLDLFLNGIGDDGAKALAAALKNNTSLTSLNLGGNGIGAEGAKALATALKTNTSLTSLNLRGNRIGDDVANALAAALKTNTSLTSLNLVNNGIGDDGANALAIALETNTSLTSLNLWDNRIGDDGANALATALEKNTSLTLLNLGDNRIGTEGAKALATALKTNTSLTSLELDSNRIGDETNSTIHTLIINNREEFKSRFSQFRTTLANCQLIQKNGFSFSNIEVQGFKNKIFEFALYPSEKFTTFVPRPIPNSPYQSQVFETLNAHASPQKKRKLLLAIFSNGQYTQTPDWLR